MINSKREKIESKWTTYYISQKPRLKNSSPRIAWYDLWRSMDAIVLEAQSEIQRVEIDKGGSPKISAQDGVLTAKATSPQLCATNSLHRGLLKSAGETLTNDNNKASTPTAENRSGEKLTIHADELKDAQIVELQEKLSIFKSKLETAERHASESQRRAEAYMQATLKLSTTNEILTADNKRLARELIEARGRGVGLEEMLSSNMKKVALLVDELNKTRASVLTDRLHPVEIQSMAGLVERGHLTARAPHSEPSSETNSSGGI